MNITQWIVFIGGCALFFTYIYVNAQIKNRKKIDSMIKRDWGCMPDRTYSSEKMEMISHYFRNRGMEGTYIDDITWNDLDMDKVFAMINSTYSSVGQEYLYYMLRKPELSCEKLKKRNELIEFFTNSSDERVKVQKKFIRLGFSRNVAVTDYVDILQDIEPASNLKHYIGCLLIPASLIFTFAVNAQTGILLLLAATGHSVISYYKEKGNVERYFICISQVVKMLECTRELYELKISGLEEYNTDLKRIYESFRNVVKNSSLISTGKLDGSPVEVILDYVRMITHIDLIKFNNIIKKINSRGDDIYELIECLGRIESAIAVASFREQLPYWSVPELVQGNNNEIKIDEIFHPLIIKPVVNSISVSRPVLLTGSNASGKSTFLKMTAINAILSQTIYTSTTKSYRAGFYRIYSSMSLRDDLGSSESYYIVEIKALKRILDAINESDIPVMCFIDEVLRGTNTVERIAASSQILLSLAKRGVLAFAATHDIELTYILENHYGNYHFQEEVTDGNIIFSYRLHEGRATSRNAIKLLGIIGYDDEIIKTSEEMAAGFAGNGRWSTLN